LILIYVLSYACWEKNEKERKIREWKGREWNRREGKERKRWKSGQRLFSQSQS
jgi:hypothetical protein